MMDIWPATLVTGATFALSQFLVSNDIGPELVDVVTAIFSTVALVTLFKGVAAQKDLDFGLVAWLG